MDCVKASHFALVWLVGLLLIAGCGDKGDDGPATVPVEGKVVMNGGGSVADLANSSVMLQFESVDQPGTIAYGSILEDGTIVVATQTSSGEKRGAVPGKHRVQLNADERAQRFFNRKYLRYGTSGWTVELPSEQPIEIKISK